MEDKRIRLEQSLYKWLDAADIVEEDIIKLINENNIAKSKIAKHVSDMKIRLRTMENIIKYY